MQVLTQFISQLFEFIGNHYILTTAFLIVLTLLIITEGARLAVRSPPSRRPR